MSDQIPVNALDASGVRDDTTFLRGDGTWAVPAGGTAAALVPLTTTVGGVPELVWDAADNLVMTEVPL